MRKTIQEKITDFLRRRGPRAASGQEISRATRVPVTSVWMALERLDGIGAVYRFSVDNTPYCVLMEFRLEAYVDLKTSIPKDVARLYGVFGTRFPKSVRRTPAFTIADDQKPAFNRYLLAENAA